MSADQLPNYVDRCSEASEPGTAPAELSSKIAFAQLEGGCGGAENRAGLRHLFKSRPASGESSDQQQCSPCRDLTLLPERRRLQS